MSLLSGTLVSGGSSRLHVGEGQKNGRTLLRKSRSHAGFLAPLVQLARNPVGTLNSAISSQYSVPEADSLGADAQRIQILYLRIKDAESYDEWKAAATELDALEGNDPWKHDDDDSSEYDAALIAARLKDLDDARLNCDLPRIRFLLRTTLARDLGGIGNLHLYKHSHIGTKKLIERYIDSVEQTLAALLDISAKQGDQCPFSPRVLLDQIKCTRASFGRSALLLSGGGTFGMNHIGVVKCLWDAHLLPRIISGASAGSIVSSVLCTKTDEEIPEVMHEFCYGDLDVFDKAGESEGLLSKVVRMFKTGGLFDISHLARVMEGLLGDMTFQEAYYRTQRILNIPVSTSSHFELPRLLNYITAPNVIIWSAVCTSCSVPLVYKKASLLAKDPKTRKHVPWDPNPETTWIDGSVDNDLPMTRLAEMWNVNHFIVSQVNPHVVPFLVKDTGRNATKTSYPTAFSAGPGWLSNGLSLARGELVHRMQVLVDLSIMPSMVTKARSVLSQRYSGDINIFPQISMVDFPKVLSNPTPEYMVGCMLAGQRATWPKLSRIQNHVSIELALDAAVHELEGRAFIAEREQERLYNLSRPVSSGQGLSHAQRSKSSHKITRSDVKTEPSSPIFRKSAPTSPLLSRASLRLPPQFVSTSAEQASANSSRKRSDTPGVKYIQSPAFEILSPSSVAEESSDREYFAEVESDTTDILSSPSPIASPPDHGPTLWPSSAHYTPYPSSPQPTSHLPTVTTPPISTSADRRTGVLLNLSMTSAKTPSPSSPELRYKKLFHPAGPVEPDAIVSGEPPHQRSRPGSRRGSVTTPTPDLSGTRGMLLRKKSFAKLTSEEVLEE